MLKKYVLITFLYRTYNYKCIFSVLTEDFIIISEMMPNAHTALVNHKLPFVGQHKPVLQVLSCCYTLLQKLFDHFYYMLPKYGKWALCFFIFKNIYC